MKSILRVALISLGIGAIAAPTVSFAATSTVSTRKIGSRFEDSIRHELVMLPYFGVFDNLAFSVDGSTVTLSGQVVRPTLRSDAERVVRHIEGVQTVVNNIEVLPPSPFDDQIRLAEYRSIFGFASLGRYSWGPVPSLHIIVKNGHVTLEGVVANPTDSNLAKIRANGVSGVFTVENNLKIDKRS
jgi:hyperosmotically inducible protein